MANEPKISVVTGAGSGLGRAFAEKLAKSGATLVLSDIDAEGLAETAERCEAKGATVVSTVCDVTKLDEVEAMRELAMAEGEVDLVINNAGVAVGGPVGDVSLEDWRWVVEVNLFGVIHGCHAFLPEMKKRGRGAIINVASAAGLVSMPRMAPYNVTKAGVVALSETLFGELRGTGVRVTVLCPTFFQTNIVQSGRGVIDEQDSAMAEEMMRKSKVQAPEVANAALEASLAGELYAVPMLDARAAWRAKRLSPQRFYKGLAFSVEKLKRRLAR